MSRKHIRECIYRADKRTSKADLRVTPCLGCGELIEPTGTQKYCRENGCQKSRSNQRWHEWYERSGNREKLNEYQRKYRKETNHHRIYWVKSKYGLEWDEYLALLDAFGNKCAICGTSEDLCVDHCHTTGAVRGILCRKHNAGLGSLGDTIEGLEKALDYLRKVAT